LHRALELPLTAPPWLRKWFDPSDPRADGALSAEYVKLFVAGLRQR
jgi:hypothetical protein